MLTPTLTPCWPQPTDGLLHRLQPLPSCAPLTDGQTVLLGCSTASPYRLAVLPTVPQVLTYVGPFTLVAPVSIAFGAWAGTVAPVAHLVLSCFAAGTFLYVGCSEVLAEEFEGDVRCGRRDISQLQARLYKFGVVVFAVLSIAAMGLMPHEH